jgi:hypothetical protein
MPFKEFTQAQEQFICAPIDGSLFVEGPAATGKTTAAIARLDRILETIPGYQILVISPQQSLGLPYRHFVMHENGHSGGIPKVTTMSGLAQEMAGIFWPAIRSVFQFTGQSNEPFFLSLETAQYCMARVVEPLLEQGYFQSVKIDRNRLFSQIIDNMNKSAIHGLPLDAISSRLQASAVDPVTLGNAFVQVEECARLFRTFCLANNLIDFSLLVTIASNYLFKEILPQQYLSSRFKVLLADNIEEDTPFAHAFFSQWLNSLSSTTMIFDHDGGFRTFLGADAENAYHLKTLCNNHLIIDEPIHPAGNIHSFRKRIVSCINRQSGNPSDNSFPDTIDLTVYQYLPEMIDGVIGRIDGLVRSGIPAENIAVLSPYLSEVLKFSLTEKLDKLGVPAQTSRPSREYLASSAIKAVLTLARIAHPAWHLPVSHYSFRGCLMRLVPNLDIIRGEQAAKALLASQQGEYTFRSFESLTNLALQECITFSIGQKLEKLFRWISEYRQGPVLPLDIFIQRLFGEILSQPDFRLHNDMDAANDISRLINSVRTFRSFSTSVFNFDEPALGGAYAQSIDQGLLPSSFSGSSRENEGVLIAPAHTFLMKNETVDFQFWLDIGSLGWWERLYQPLTNPYVYQSGWTEDAVWNEQREYTVNQDMMAKVVNGLLLRCRQGVIASIVQTNEYGTQNSGPLLKAFQKMIKKSKLKESNQQDV